MSEIGQNGAKTETICKKTTTVSVPNTVCLSLSGYVTAIQQQLKVTSARMRNRMKKNDGVESLRSSFRLSGGFS